MTEFICPLKYWWTMHSSQIYTITNNTVKNILIHLFWWTSVQFSRWVMSDSLWPHGLQHARLPCPSPAPRACSNSYPLSRWCHPTILSSVVPFSSCLQTFPASGSFPMSQFFTSGGQTIGVSASASVLPMNSLDWFPLGVIGLISLLSQGLSRVFSNITVQKHRYEFIFSMCWGVKVAGHRVCFMSKFIRYYRIVYQQFMRVSVIHILVKIWYYWRSTF